MYVVCVHFYSANAGFSPCVPLSLQELGIEYLEPATMCLERPGQQREPEEEEEEEDAVGPSASAAVSTRTRTSAPRRFFQGEATGTPSTATASLGMWK